MSDDTDITNAVGSRPAWMSKGRCAKPVFDPRDWFLEGRFKKGSAAYNKAKARAKAICALCPVAAACLQHALDNDIRDGIWGGATVSERRAIKYPKHAAPSVAVEIRMAS